MRLRITDRILVAVAGILLLAICAGIVAQLFFGVDLVGAAARAFASDAPQSRFLLAAAALILFLLGVYCVLVLFRHRRKKDKFFMQKNENGEIAISVHALENMVRKCLEGHDELSVQKLHLENKKDGLLIYLRGTVAGGISIPLTIEVFQKQIRQYVTACSGVEIKGIRVEIDASGEDAQNAPFAIAAPAGKALLQEAEVTQLPAAAGDEPESLQTPAAPQEERPDTTGQPAPAANSTLNIPLQDVPEDDRPLHQRLFSTPMEPCIVPAPPTEEDSLKPETEADDSGAGEAPAEETKEETGADTTEDGEEKIKQEDLEGAV